MDLEEIYVDGMKAKISRHEGDLRIDIPNKGISINYSSMNGLSPSQIELESTIDSMRAYREELVNKVVSYNSKKRRMGEKKDDLISKVVYSPEPLARLHMMKIHYKDAFPDWINFRSPKPIRKAELEDIRETLDAYERLSHYSEEGQNIVGTGLDRSHGVFRDRLEFASQVESGISKTLKNIVSDISTYLAEKKEFYDIVYDISPQE